MEMRDNKGKIGICTAKPIRKQVVLSDRNTSLDNTALDTRNSLKPGLKLNSAYNSIQKYKLTMSERKPAKGTGTNRVTSSLGMRTRSAGMEPADVTTPAGGGPAGGGALTGNLQQLSLEDSATHQSFLELSDTNSYDLERKFEDLATKFKAEMRAEVNEMKAEVNEMKAEGRADVRTKVHQGTVTAASYAVQLQSKGRLNYSSLFDSELEMFGDKGQSKRETVQSFYPKLLDFSVLSTNAEESDVQNHFSAVETAVTNGLVHPTSFPQLDAHTAATIGTRKPDCVYRVKDLSGESSIVFIGDIKCRNGDNDFNWAEVGTILDFTQELLECQPARIQCYSFLTDGWRFLFFRGHKNIFGEINFNWSPLILGDQGWNIYFGFLTAPLTDLRFQVFEAKGWTLQSYLGQGLHSTVYSATRIVNQTSSSSSSYSSASPSSSSSSSNSEKVVIKFLNCEESRNREKTALEKLVAVPNVPKLVPYNEEDRACQQSLYPVATAWVTVLTPVGTPVGPVMGGLPVQGKDIAVLVDVLHAAHLRGLAHRDVKPSNIFIAPLGPDVTPSPSSACLPSACLSSACLPSACLSSACKEGMPRAAPPRFNLFLNDWGSSVDLGVEVQYEGTYKYSLPACLIAGDEWHVPTASDDLCALVRAGYSMCYNRYIPNFRTVEECIKYWDTELPSIWCCMMDRANACDYEGLKRLLSFL